MATTARTRSGLLFWILLAVTVYALTSGGIAVATGDKCGGMQAEKTWQYVPPGWQCTPRRLPGQF